MRPFAGLKTLWHQSASASTSASSGVASSRFDWKIRDLTIDRNIERRVARYLIITGRGYLSNGVTAKLEIEPGGAAGVMVVFDDCVLAEGASINDLYMLKNTGFQGNRDHILHIHEISLDELLEKAREIASPGKKQSKVVNRGNIEVGGDVDGNIVMGDHNRINS